MELNFMCKDCKDIFRSEEEEVKWYHGYPVCTGCTNKDKEEHEG
ncbi:MAG: hypothetical protein ACRCX2_04380 [Paraclostridium sp.]